MSTTRSTMSQVTSFNNRLDSTNKENTLILPTLTESKIIFMNNYNKNRNLSKSLVIKLPFSQEKSLYKLQTFHEEPETQKTIKPILKSAFRKRLQLDLPLVHESSKNVKFIDEVNEEDDHYPENTTNYYNFNDKTPSKTLNSNANGKENVNLNANTQELLSNTKNKNIEDNKDESFFSKSNRQNNKNNKKIIINAEQKEQTKIKFNKSLAEIITVPSYRNFNIYRTSSKDFINKNFKEEESHAKCKCCTIF